MDKENIWILTNEKYRDIVSEIDPSLNPEQIIGEPMVRDTSAAIALRAGLINKKDPVSIMVVLPADHIINNINGFINSIKKAVKLAEDDNLVTIGVGRTF